MQLLGRLRIVLDIRATILIARSLDIAVCLSVFQHIHHSLYCDVCARLEKSESCECEKTSALCRVESHGGDPEPQPCDIQPTDLCRDMAEPYVSMHPADSSYSETKSPVTDSDIVWMRDMTSFCRHSSETSEGISSYETDLTLEAEQSTGTTAHLGESLLVTTDCSDKCQAQESDVVEDADSSHLRPHPSAHSDESNVINSVPEHHLPPCTDSVLSLDSASCHISSVQSESETAIGFSESEDVHTVDDMCGKHEDRSSTQMESFTRNTNSEGHSHYAVSAIDASSSGSSDSPMPKVTESAVTKLIGKRRVRSILTASVSEVPQLVAETAAHIGSTRIHVTDELTVVNGVVQLVESAVKIGKFYHSLVSVKSASFMY